MAKQNRKSILCSGSSRISKLRCFLGGLAVVAFIRLISNSKQLSSRLSDVDVALEFEPLLTDAITDEWKRELYGRLDALRRKCGVLCSINDKVSFLKYLVRHPGAPPVGDPFSMEEYPPHLEAPVNCRSLFELEEIDAGDSTFPERPPDELQPFYTLGGLATVYYDKIYRRQYLESNAMVKVWTKDNIELGKQKSLRKENGGTYGVKVTNEAFTIMRDKIDLEGKSVLVIGSEKPWLESAALAVGAARVTTLEYGSISSQHPDVNTMTPNEFRLAYLRGELPRFDAVLTVSSLEHSGLGRYGDALNPWGDILSLARAWCTTKPGGLLLLNVPSWQDKIQWNAHRWYGRYRWPLLTINWEPIGPYKESQNGQILAYRLFRKISSK
mmetsp:Transcript_43292/g.101502  ORF Transcript_43292/g.101502 Transcript_43292/m.101502 type:complete len:384 (-) Transcript_43292:254-1405(-)